MYRAHGLAFATLLSLFTFGCENVVTTAGADATDDVPGGQGGSPSTTSSSSSQGTGGSGPVHGTDLAVVNGDKLEVTLASYDQVCASDATPGCGPAASWKVTFDLPVASLTPGSVVTMKDAQGFEGGTDAQDPQNPGFCGGGGGTYWDGAIEVVSVDDTSVKLHLTGTSPILFGGGNMDGDHTVLLCGPKPPPPHALTSAIATGPDSAVTLHVENLPSTCSDPDNDLAGCSVEHAGVSIQLGPGMLTPGVYPLDHIATFSDWAPDANAQCSGGGGSYWSGTIEILSADAASVSFTLAGTDAFFLNKGNADGTYTASRCY
jgi:hypothetical protein